MKSVREEFDALSPRYEMRWRTYIRRSVRETLARANLQSGQRVLDLGCGTGALLRELAGGVRAAGVDLSHGMLARARSAGAWLVAGDAESLPFRGGSFDVVITSSSFHFWPHPKRGLFEIRRVLRWHGRLILTDWCDDFMACRMCNAFLRMRSLSHPRIFSRSECAALLEESGFKVLRIEGYKVSWLWGLMTAVAEIAERG